MAYFIPGIVYLADAVGTQTEALVVRGLSVGVASGGWRAGRPSPACCVGGLLGVLDVRGDRRGLGRPAVAAAVALAVLAASSIAVLVALALPWLLQRLGATRLSVPGRSPP